MRPKPAEAKQLQETDAKRQAALSILKTKKAERDTRAAQKKTAVDRPPEAPSPKPVTAPAPEAQGEAEQSHHEFLDPREGELWDTMRLHEVIWRQAEAIDPATFDIGFIYIPP